MFSDNKKRAKPHKLKGLFAGILYSCALLALATAAFIITRITFSADRAAVFPADSQKKIERLVSAAPANTPSSNVPPQTQAQRIKITIGETRDVPFPSEIKTATVVSPEIASGQIKSSGILTITALKIGETILIISDTERRYTFVVEVAGKPLSSERQNIIREDGANSRQSKTTGSYSAAYAHSFSDNAPLLKQNIEYRRAVSKDKTLRVSAEISKLFGENKPGQALVRAPDYAFNRLSVGIDSPDKTIDFLDSRVNVSPMSLNNYTMRGFHLVKTPKSASDSRPKISSGSSLTDKRIEVFAGMARPSLAFFDNDRGWLAGVNAPVAGGEIWQVRAGLMTVIAPKNNRFGGGGTILQLSGAFAPNEKFSADGEIALSLIHI